MHLLIWQNYNHWAYSWAEREAPAAHASECRNGISAMNEGASKACENASVLDANEDVFDITVTAPRWWD